MDDRFDLLGDPIPENWGRRGRPEHRATERTRNKVMMLLGLGWANPRIAAALAITLPTLRKHYARELRVREEARDRLDAIRFERCYDQAIGAGNVGAMRLLDQMIARNDGMLGILDRKAKAEPPPKLGKKEERVAAATRVIGKFAPPPPPRLNG